MSKLTKAKLDVDQLDVVADRGYFSSLEILACADADITVTLCKPQTSNNKKRNLFDKADFRYDADKDVYVCPTGEQLRRRMKTQVNRPGFPGGWFIWVRRRSSAPPGWRSILQAGVVFGFRFGGRHIADG